VNNHTIMLKLSYACFTYFFLCWCFIVDVLFGKSTNRCIKYELLTNSIFDVFMVTIFIPEKEYFVCIGSQVVEIILRSYRRFLNIPKN